VSVANFAGPFVGPVFSVVKISSKSAIANRQSEMKHQTSNASDIVFKKKDDQFRTSAVDKAERLRNSRSCRLNRGNGVF
jgi:hypothetical protein